MARNRDLQVPAPEGPLSGLSRAQLRMLDRGLASIDSLNEAESGKRASAATLNAGQAAVNAVNSLRGVHVVKVRSGMPVCAAAEKQSPFQFQPGRPS